MKLSSSLLAFAILAFGWAQTNAADLTKVDRSIGKEPAYRSPPKYCLLVFGPDAKDRVWLALDGDHLYVDRNGNGDLTEDGEKIAKDKATFVVGDLRVGSSVHKNFSVQVQTTDSVALFSDDAKALFAKNPKAQWYVIAMDVELPGWKGAGEGGRVKHHAALGDFDGILQFADSPKDAPILHFGGPRRIMLTERQQLTIGRSQEMNLAVGTPGFGPGSTVFTAYENVVPKTSFPVVTITYPPKTVGAEPIRERYELKQRC